MKNDSDTDLVMESFFVFTVIVFNYHPQPVYLRGCALLPI